MNKHHFICAYVNFNLCACSNCNIICVFKATASFINIKSFDRTVNAGLEFNFYSKSLL